MNIVSRALRVALAQLSTDPRQRLSQLNRCPYYRDYDAFLGTYLKSGDFPRTTAIDLGCSKNPKNPFAATQVYGIDIDPHNQPTIIKCDLFHGMIPLINDKASIITAFDFIEHVPRVSISDQGTRFPFVELMSEVYRILEPGGIFFHASPAYPNKEAFSDPTHVNIITEDTFPRYFCFQSQQDKPWACIYGFVGNFKLIKQGWVGPRLCTLMAKPKGEYGP